MHTHARIQPHYPNSLFCVRVAQSIPPSVSARYIITLYVCIYVWCAMPAVDDGVTGKQCGVLCAVCGIKRSLDDVAKDFPNCIFLATCYGITYTFVITYRERSTFSETETGGIGEAPHMISKYIKIGLEPSFRINLEDLLRNTHEYNTDYSLHIKPYI